MDVPKDLVQAMLDAHYGAGICASQQFNHSLEQIAGMRRAARVCIERCREKMLKDITPDEQESAWKRLMELEGAAGDRTANRYQRPERKPPCPISL